MPSNHPKLPPPPQPTRIFFDPFNSSSTGHQTAPSRLSGSTSWRQLRSRKLAHQFRDATGGGGTKHVSDTVGAGSEDWQKYGQKENGDWKSGAPGLREEGWQDIRGLLGNTKKRRSGSIAANENEDANSDASKVSVSSKRQRLDTRNGHGHAKSTQRRKLPSTFTTTNQRDVKITIEVEADSIEMSQELKAHNNEDNDGKGNANDNKCPKVHQGADENAQVDADDPDKPLPQIFRGVNIYLNGSTAPLISDHKLKQLFTLHGGNSSISLGRRTVTHVILGEKCGGGLASGKIQKENTTVRGKGIKFVTVQWVLDSIEKGIRQPESKYAAVEVRDKLGGSGQRSVARIFRKDDG